MEQIKKNVALSHTSHVVGAHLVHDGVIVIV